jgi:predicted ATP-grasp superfamily ATP-dependent carboligase
LHTGLPEARLSKRTTPVLALGAGITLLGTLRALGRARIRAFVASAVTGFVRRSRWCHALALPLIEATDPAVLAESLRRLPLQNAVLMPCTDNWSAAVAGLEGDVRERFPASISGPDVQEILVDKARFAATLRRTGVPHPRTVEVRSLDDLEALPERDFASAFLKPCASQSFSAKYGVKAFRSADKAATLERYRQVERDGLDLVLQEYVPGPPNCHYFIDGFVDRHGSLLALFARRRLRMHPADFGNSTCMVSVPPGEVAPAVAPLRRLLRELRFRGIFSAEFKRDPRDGAFKLLEVNARPWWYIGFALACGVNVARLAYEDALGLPTAPVRDYRVGVRCVFPQLDWVACARLRRAGRMTWRECLRDWTFSVKPIFAWDDPLPALRNAVSLAGVAMRRLLPGPAAPPPAVASAVPESTVAAGR